MLTPNKLRIEKPIALSNGTIISASDLATELICKFSYVWNEAADHDGAPFDRRCFHRAGKIARRHFKRYMYCEGSCDGNHHGWLLGRDGAILDPTYGSGTRSYIGIPFAMWYGDSFLRKGFALLDFIRTDEDLDFFGNRLVTPTEVRTWMVDGCTGRDHRRVDRAVEIARILGREFRD